MEENQNAALPVDVLSAIIDADQAMTSAVRAAELRRCAEVILHVYRCENAECVVEKCSKVKQFRMHLDAHIASDGSPVYMTCRICKYVIFLAAFHARACREADCPVPSCNEIKSRLVDPRVAGERVTVEALARAIATAALARGRAIPALARGGAIPAFPRLAAIPALPRGDAIPALARGGARPAYRRPIIIPPVRSSAREASNFFVMFDRVLELVENKRLKRNPKLPLCSVCMEDIMESCKPIATPCGHVFCEICINDCLGIYDFCPKCKRTVPPGSCVKLDMFDDESS